MTPRAILIGTISTCLIAGLTPYSDLVMRGTWIGLTSFPISAFFILLCVILLVTFLPRRFGVKLSQAELMTIYCMALVAAGIPSFGWTGLLIPYLAGPMYFANPENKWEETLLPHFAKWLRPAEGSAVTGLYEGLHPGDPIPWAAWGVPLLAWSMLAIAIYLCFFSLSALLRRRWMDDEKLVFPLVHLPIEMARQDNIIALAPPFFRNRLMWGFFCIPFFIHAFNGLHYYVPSVPMMNIHLISLDTYLTERPWNAMQPMWLRCLFSIIGLSYLLPSEISFSLFTFFFFFVFQQLIGGLTGLPMPMVQAYPTKRFVAHQMIGGVFSYFALGLWASRPRIKEILNSALSSRKPGEKQVDEGEAMPYRWAAWGLTAGILGTVAWSNAAGANSGWAFLLIALYLILHIVAVRLVCEGGMLYVQHPFRPFNILLAAVGSRGLGANTTTVLALLDHLLMLDNRSPLMPGIMQSLRIAEAVRLPRRSLMGWMAVAVVLSLVVSYFSYLKLMYMYGGSTLNEWFTTYYSKNLFGTWTNHLIVNGETASPMTFLVMAAGALTMWGLAFMHRTYVWWPLHPIGYLMGASWPNVNFWFPIAVGWFIKTTVLRFGGHKVYKSLLPGFLGLIMGEFTAAGVWLIIDLLTGVRGHAIFSF